MSTAAPRLPDALQALRDLLAEAPLHLDVAGRDEARRSARAVVDQVDDYLLPRLRDLDAPCWRSSAAPPAPVSPPWSTACWASP